MEQDLAAEKKRAQDELAAQRERLTREAQEKLKNIQSAKANAEQQDEQAKAQMAEQQAQPQAHMAAQQYEMNRMAIEVERQKKLLQDAANHGGSTAAAAGIDVAEEERKVLEQQRLEAEEKQRQEQARAAAEAPTGAGGAAPGGVPGGATTTAAPPMAAAAPPMAAATPATERMCGATATSAPPGMSILAGEGALGSAARAALGPKVDKSLINFLNLPFNPVKCKDDMDFRQQMSKAAQSEQVTLFNTEKRSAGKYKKPYDDAMPLKNLNKRLIGRGIELVAMDKKAKVDYENMMDWADATVSNEELAGVIPIMCEVVKVWQKHASGGKKIDAYLRTFNVKWGDSFSKEGMVASLAFCAGKQLTRSLGKSFHNRTPMQS